MIHIRIALRLVLLALLLGPAGVGVAVAQKAQGFELLSGSMQQGSLVIARTQAGAAVEVDGVPVRVLDDGRFIFGLDRDAPETVQIAVSAPGLPELRQRYAVAHRNYNIQRLSFPQSGKPAPPEVEERLAADAEANKEARSRDSDLPYAFEQFIWPAVGRHTGVFGSQRVINGETRQPHYGIDIAGKTGTAVLAPADGVVSLTANMLLSGGTLYLDHGQGVSSAFLHLSRILVAEGQKVLRGQKIAEIGRTGRVTGPHLHWQVNWLQARVDAAQLVLP